MWRGSGAVEGTVCISQRNVATLRPLCARLSTIQNSSPGMLRIYVCLLYSASFFLSLDTTPLSCEKPATAGASRYSRRARSTSRKKIHPVAASYFTRVTVLFHCWFVKRNKHRAGGGCSTRRAESFRCFKRKADTG